MFSFSNVIMAGLFFTTMQAGAACLVQMLDKNSGQPISSEIYRGNSCQEALRDCNRERVRLYDRNNYSCKQIDDNPGLPDSPFPLPSIGEKVVLLNQQNYCVIERRTLNGKYEVRNLTTRKLYTVGLMDLGRTQGCIYHPVQKMCISDIIVDRNASDPTVARKHNSEIEAIFPNGLVAHKNFGLNKRLFTQAEEMAVTSGCVKVHRYQDLCVNDTVRIPNQTHLSTVEGFFGSGEVLVKNNSTKKRFILFPNELQ